MKWQVIKIRVLQGLKRIIFYGLYATLFFFIVGFSILQIPAVQKTLIGRITDRFSEVSGFKVEFDQFYLLWYDRLEITGLRITDPEDHTMIEAGKLFVNFRISSAFQKGDVYLDAVSLQGGAVNLVTVPVTDSTYELNIDRFIAAINRQISSGKGGGGGGQPAKINIGEVLVEQSEFSYHRPEKDSIRGFDYNHFKVAVDGGSLDNFKVIGDTIEFNLSSLLVKDYKTGLSISQFSTFFRISQLSMEFLGIDLLCNQSHISDTIVFRYGSQRDLNDFNRKVTIDARLKKTKLYPQDVSLFTRGLEDWKEPVTLSGQVSGRVNHFNFQPMEVLIGSSILRGSLQMDGLPSIDETFINANLKPSVIYAKDIAFLLPDAVTTTLSPLNRMQFHASFLGFINDFVAKGDFETMFGRVQSDINYKISDNIKQSSYSGNLKLFDFDLGRFVDDTTRYQRVTLNGRIKGKGFARETADFTLVGEIPSIGVLGYNYTDIQSNAHFAKQFFEGAVNINDPNLSFSMKGSIDLRQGRDIINIKAKLDTALLHELKLTRQEVFLQSDITIDSRGLQLDSIIGSALLENASIRFRDETIMLDSIHVISSNDSGQRNLTLRSSTLDLSLTGDFFYSTMFHDLQKIGREFMLSLKNDQETIRSYYAAKKKTEQTYKANINIDIHNLDPLLQMLDLDLHVSPETKVEGEFINNETSILNIYAHIDSLSINGQIFEDNQIEISGSKIRDSTDVLAQVTITSGHQQLNKVVVTKDIFLEAIWNEDHIDLDFDIAQDGLNSAVQMKAEIDFLHDSTRIKVLPSMITLLGERWDVTGNNYILTNGTEWSIHNLGLISKRQSILVTGDVSKDPSRSLRIDIRDFELSILNLFSTEKFKGRLNANIVQRDVYANLFVENVLRIDSLTVNNFLVGEIRGNNTRDPVSNRFNIDITVDRIDNRIVDIKGYYDPRDKASPLHTKAILQKANLKLIEPVVKGLFSQMDGTLTGEYEIVGTFTDPSITGESKVENGQVMINYLKTLYKVSGTLGMAPNQIQFNDFVLTDAFRNRGTLEGYIAHRNFSRMTVNLNASFANLNLLNTTQKDNSLFYGQAYGTGTLSIMGPVSHLIISATARTNKNTRLSIPIGGTSIEAKKDFIKFASLTDTTQKKKGKVEPRKRELSGITMDLNIDVTPDAYAEIIFDIKSGDIIRGRGRGDLKLQVDTKGDFNMFGRVEFTEGAYNFTLYDIINKEFTLDPRGSITWTGDPYGANLNITARYRQYTSMAPILMNQSVINDPQVKRRYPVEVLLKLEGPMMSPQISFDLEARDLPDNIVTADHQSVRMKFDFNAFKTKLDEQGMKLQVFSLIVLRKLSPPDAFTVSATSSIYNSVSELLSNQLSYWLSQVDENLEIDLDLGTLDQEAFNTFQLRLSYSFLNGRLRVSKDGNFGGNQSIPKSELSTIAGDWTVDYLLTPDGKFRVKMYSRSSVNQLQSTLNTQTAAVTTGASLLYTENFNEFKDLLRSAREKRRKELEQNPPDEQTDGTKGSH